MILILARRILRNRTYGHFLVSSTGHREHAYSTAESIAHPPSSTENRVYSEHITKIVNDIAKLNLLEVADLNELLKKTLNIKETPMFGAPIMAAPTGQSEDTEEQAPAPTAVKTSFSVKILKFDESKKVALIKEIKNIMEGFNLVQAKKFVEGAPQIVKADLSKDEAEKLHKSIEAVGGTCEIV